MAKVKDTPVTKVMKWKQRYWLADDTKVVGTCSENKFRKAKASESVAQNFANDNAVTEEDDYEEVFIILKSDTSAHQPKSSSLQDLD
jgi:hypothetical protein